jgi:hypothetical protein
MTSKTKPEAKAVKPEAEMLHTSDVAAMLKIDSKVLRKHLRAISGKAPGTRYEWKPTDPFLKKLPELIKAQEEKEQAAKKKA